MPPDNPQYNLPDVETVDAEIMPEQGLQTTVAKETQYLAVLGKQDISTLNTSEGLAAMNLGQRLAFASLLIESGMVPKHFNTPQKAVLAFEQGEALGLRPIEALSRLYVIDNKVAMYAELVRSRATRAGLRFRVTETKANVYQTDANGNEVLDDQGNRIVIDWRWSMEMDEWINGKKEYVYSLSRTYTWASNEAGLMRNPVWKKHMDNMFRHRISCDLVRMHRPDVLLGCYEFSELADSSPNTHAYELDADNNPVPITL